MPSINPDLVKERAAVTFNSEGLTYIWDGGQQNTIRRKQMEKLAFSDPELTAPDSRHATRDEAYSESIRRHLVFWKKLKQHRIEDDYGKMAFFAAVFGGEATGLLMHDIAFMPMLRLQASDEQLAKWLPLVESFQMFGSYAQTEIGHGTYVRGLETTAVYDERTKEFILNSPTLTSTKWWIGSLGKSTNYTILMAQLYSKGKCHGLHAFLVPLRDRNYQPLPGITVGDIGPKFGFTSIDNGFGQFSKVRIPRDNMLMRYSKVLEDGTYVKPENAKIMYGGMLGIRAGLPSSMSMALASAVTIAIRYSLVRRQSELKPNSVEPQILDFQTQQHKLFPLVARCYAYSFAGQSVKEMFQQVMAEVQSGSFSRLIEAHGLASGLKALITSRATNGIEICRLACGGHGYSLASNLSVLYTNSVSAVTAEGEATILLLQAARYLIKNCIYAQSNKKIDVYMSYLNPNSTIQSAKFDGTINMRSLLQAYEFRAASLAVKVASRLQSLVADGKLSPEEAWNQCAVHLVKAATAQTEYVIMRLFVERVENLVCDLAIRRASVTLCIVHGLYEVIENSSDLLQEGYLTGADVDALREKLFSLYQQVRVDAIAYVDAFDIDDHVLRSCLGRYDGNVYESLYEFALSSKLNETQVHESFRKYIQPVQPTSKL